MGLLDGLLGGGSSPSAPKRTNAGPEMYRYLFGFDERGPDGRRLYKDMEGVTDPRIWDQLLGFEERYREPFAELNRQEMYNNLFGNFGLLEQQRQATEYAGETAADAAQYQRERDLADVGSMAGEAVRINRESDPQRAAMMAQQQRLTDDIFARAFGITPQQERLAQQGAREAYGARGRLDDNASIFAEALGREDIMRQNRAEALGAGNAMFNQYQATSIDPWRAILGRGETATGLAGQQQAAGQGLLGGATPQFFNPDAGVNLALQHRSNQANYNSALAGANAARSGGNLGRAF